MHARKILLSVVAASVVVLFPATSHGWKADTISSLAEMNVSGPRVGMFAVLDNGPLYQELRKHKGDRAISQFGWHFEIKTKALAGGPSFLVEFVPLVAGVEYGLFIPSLSIPIGVRLPWGTEFGMGPSFAIGNSTTPVSSSIVFSVGHSFYCHGVGIPINLAFARGPAGNRIGLLAGYAITRNVRKEVQRIPQ
jgi:hypothetical protein